MIGGCSNKLDPSESNFKDAINVQLDKSGGCTESVQLEFPDYTSAGKGTDYARPQFAEKLGFVKLESIQKFPSGVGQYVKYVLTEEGKSHTHVMQVPTMIGKTVPAIKLCFARERVKKVVKWEGPTETMGHTVALVTFTSSFEDISPWATTEEFKKLFPGAAREIASKDSAESQAALLKTNIGWEVANKLF